MKRYRRKISKKRSRRMFSRTASRVHRRNRAARAMRGGIRM